MRRGACSVQNCGRPARHRTLCYRHLRDPETAASVLPYESVRHDALTYLQSRIERTPGCWIWRGYTDPSGYGRAVLPGGRYVMAHRLSYELLTGPIPDGLTLDHICRNRGCVKPQHLTPMTRGDNSLLWQLEDGRYAGATHCPQGHPYNMANTYWYGPKRTKRRCRTCNRETAATRRAEKVPCPNCGLPRTRNNLRLHIRRMHEGLAR